MGGWKLESQKQVEKRELPRTTCILAGSSIDHDQYYQLPITVSMQMQTQMQMLTNPNANATVVTMLIPVSHYLYLRLPA